MDASVRWRLIRRARFRRRELRDSGFEASSIGDLAFLLLIFFVVTSSFVVRQGVFLSLPASKGVTSARDLEVLLVEPLEGTNYLVGEEKTDEAGLKRQIIDKGGTGKEVVAVIFMRKTIPYARLVETLGVLREGGLKRISLKEAG